MGNTGPIKPTCRFKLSRLWALYSLRALDRAPTPVFTTAAPFHKTRHTMNDDDLIRPTMLRPTFEMTFDEILAALAPSGPGRTHLDP
jgi:hypothetical protein